MKYDRPGKIDPLFCGYVGVAPRPTTNEVSDSLKPQEGVHHPTKNVMPKQNL